MKISFLFLVLFLSLLSCSDNRVGDTTVSFDSNTSEILIDNFPRPKIGVTGINEISWPKGFSFNKLDMIIYNILTKEHFAFSDVKVFIRFIDKDQYGKSNPSEWKFIGKLDVDEARKYEDFEHWNSRYEIFQMFRKSE